MPVAMPLADAEVLARRAEIVAALRIVPGEGVIARRAMRALRERRPHRLSPAAAGRRPASTTEQVAAVLRYCHAQGVKVVPRGAGTSLSGGALPLADGVLLGMAKFNRILEIDFDNRFAVVQPGVTNLAITPGGASTPASITRPIRRARSPARSAAMSRRIPAACIASNTA